MKILYIIDSPILGGAEIYILRLIRVFNKKNNNLEAGIIVPLGSEVAVYCKKDQINCVEIGQPYFRGLSSLKAIFKEIKKQNPDIVHINMPGPYNCFYGGIALIAKLAGAKKVITTEHLPMHKGRFLRPFLKWIFSRYIDKTIVYTQANKNYLLKLHKMLKHKIAITSWGVESSDSIFDTNDQLIYPIIAFVGRLEEQKRPDLFLQVAKKIHDADKSIRFWIVGKGQLQQELKNKCAHLGIYDCVDFLGFQNNMQSIFNQIDLLLVTSINEGLPAVIIEAMSYKKPVVAFDVDGVREAIIHDRNGYLVPFGDIDLMSIYLLSLINDKSLIQKMGEEGYALFQEKFRLETMAKETYQIYKELSA